MNALTHGLTAKALVLPGENPADLEALHQGYRETYEPQDHVEESLVHEMAVNRWRTLRFYRMETGLFWDMYDSAADHQKRIPNYMFRPSGEEETHTCRLGGVARDCSSEHDHFRSLSRYETTIERAFHRALKTLEMRRNTIAARPASPPQKRTACETNPTQAQPTSNQQDTQRIGPGRAQPVPAPGTVAPVARPQEPINAKPPV